MKQELTNRQQAIYTYLRETITQEGCPPTMREIGARFGMKSTNGVREMLEALERKGYIRRAPYLSRAIELVDEPIAPLGDSIATVPVLGRVAAGLPLLAVENVDGHVAVDRSFLPTGEVFSLRVTGDSMVDEGIHDGDFVLVKKQPTARPGQIVVAIIGDEATVKTYYPEKKSRVRLQPANDAYGPILVDKNSPGFFLAGLVVGLMRKY